MQENRRVVLIRQRAVRSSVTWIHFSAMGSPVFQVSEWPPADCSFPPPEAEWTSRDVEPFRLPGSEEPGTCKPLLCTGPVSGTSLFGVTLGKKTKADTQTRAQLWCQMSLQLLPTFHEFYSQPVSTLIRGQLTTTLCVYSNTSKHVYFIFKYNFRQLQKLH